MSEKKVDIHVHVVGTGDSGSGCRLLPELATRSFFAPLRDSLNIVPFEASDGMIRELLIDSVNSCEKIDRAVLLATDGVYKNSRLIEAETHLMAPNSYVAQIAGKNDRLLFGASVHPYRDRREMLDEMDRCLDMGAVLFNWAPCVQQVDPEDERCVPFYIRLAREGVPLLCHTGTEFGVMPPDGKTEGNGSPKKMIKALDIGVKVITAGIAYFDELIEMLSVSEENSWALYADISCLFTPAGLFSLERMTREIAYGTIGADRIIYGSDFPASLATKDALVPALGEHSFRSHKNNPLDERYEVAMNLGVPESAFTNAWSVLRPLSG